MLNLAMSTVAALRVLCVSSADANDAAQFAELKTQGELTRRAWEKNVQVCVHYIGCGCMVGAATHALFLAQTPQLFIFQQLQCPIFFDGLAGYGWLLPCSSIVCCRAPLGKHDPPTISDCPRGRTGKASTCASTASQSASQPQGTRVRLRLPNLAQLGNAHPYSCTLWQGASH